MKPFSWLLLCSIALLIVACSSSQKEMEKVLAGEEFGGITPCADCEGIAYSLIFFANSRYESRSMYIGESNRIFTEEGSWHAIKDSVIELNPREGDSKKLKVKDGRLQLLDRSGQEIEGDLSGRYTLRNIRKRPLMGTVNRQPDSTVDFKAHGNEPFWGLQIERDSLLSFKMISGDSLGIAMENIEVDSTGGVQTYRMPASGDSLKIELHPVGCMDSMSGQVYDYRVQVNKGGNEYSGCGGYVNKNM